MYTLNFDFAALTVYFFCLVYSLVVRRRQYIPPKGLKSKLLNQHFVFMLILQVSILSAAASVASVYFTEHAGDNAYWLVFLMNELFFMSHTTLTMCLTLYFMNVNGSALGRKPYFFWGYAAPYLLGELLIITNPLTKLAFYLDDNLIYHRGPIMPMLYMLALFYVVTGFYFFFRYKRAISHANSIVIVSVVAMAAIGVIVQALRPDLLVELFLESLAILTLMIILEDYTGSMDQETHVFNRRAFNDTNQRLIENKQHYSIVLMKFLNFNFFSRLFNSRDMNRLMAEVAAWLETMASREDIFRFWQEGFAIILSGANVPDAGSIARQVLDRFEATWKTDEFAAKLEAVVGVVRVPEDVQTLTQLQDLLISGFQRTQPSSLLLTHDEIASFQRSLTIEDALRRALRENTIEVWYQPIWSVETGNIVAAEALARMNDSALGSIPPDEFIPIAEKSGMIHELGSHVFSETCRVIGQHGLKRRGINYIDVNISIYQFLRDDLISSFERMRAIWGVDAKQINLEITEGRSFDEVPSINDTIAHMIGMGYSFSLDDYGTGYSNLSRLLEKEYTNVKIDKSILWGGEHNPATARLLSNLISVIRSMNKNVVQEGVETKEQFERAVSSGVNLIQGFYFSKPLPESDFIAYIDKMNSR